MRLDRVRGASIENSQRAQIEAMIVDMERRVLELDTAIETEEQQTGIHQPTHFAYSTIAMAMARRRDNLKQSIDGLRRQLSDARATSNR